MVLQSAGKFPEAELRELEVVGREEAEKLVQEFNRSEVEYGDSRLLHQMFEQQVERDGSRTALVLEEEKVSYGELNRRANQLAHYLRMQGIGAESLVGVFLERSVEMVVALMAILKAGGAYLPLDPSYPEERLRYMIE